jgi:hypothetical protein
VLFPGVKHLGHEFDHSASSSADFKNKWGYTSIPVLCLHGVGRKNFTFILNNVLIIIDSYVNAAG